MHSDATTVEEYLASLPDGYVESMAFGMIGWGIPLEDYPDTYNGQPLGSRHSQTRRTTWRSI